MRRNNTAYSSSLLLLALIFCTTEKMRAQEKSDRTRYFPQAVEYAKNLPRKENLWVFILAGQSNMAGRGFVEPQDTVASPRILTLTAGGQIVLAKEPLHFYEPKMTGLDCGLSFGKQLLQTLPDSISILLIPTAVGGSSISQWLGDSLYRNVQLLTNFRDKAQTGKQYGQVKAILWHQGESDANEKNIPHYQERLTALIRQFRSLVGNESLPVLIGKLGSFQKDAENRQRINQAIQNYCATDPNTALIATDDLKDRGDQLHFDSEGQRVMGQRFADAYRQKFR